MKKLCIIEGCDREASGGRGLCSACYQSLHRSVKAGDTTWDELERLGLCQARCRSPRQNPAQRALERRRGR